MAALLIIIVTSFSAGVVWSMVTKGERSFLFDILAAVVFAIIAAYYLQWILTLTL